MTALIVPADSGPTRLTTLLISVLPAFVVPNVQETAEHYRDQLGFRLCWVLGEHPGQFGIVDLAEGQGIHLKSVDPSCVTSTGRLPARRARSGQGEDLGCDAYIRISDADKRYADLVRRGARVLGPAADRPYGQREFLVEDRNGFVLCFGADLTGEWPAGGVATAPELVVADVSATARFYRERMGFEVKTWGAPPEYAIAVRDDVRLHFGRAAPGAPITSNAPVELWDAYVECFGVRALHGELAVRGADIVRAPFVTEYGNLEMWVRDPDGHVLCFGVLRDDVARGEG